MAAEEQRSFCVTYLLESHADVNKKDRCQLTALHLAAANGNLDIVEQLLQQPGLVRDEQDLWGWTPLHRAVINYQGKVASRLLQDGALVNIPDENKSSVLHVAASYGQVGLIQELLDAGANINCQDVRGRTPLYLAVVGAYSDVVDLLLENGCDPGLAAHNDITPLALAVQKGLSECLEVLLHRGAACCDPESLVSSLVELAILQASEISRQRHSHFLHIAILLLQAGLEPRNSFRLTYRLVRKNNSPEFFHLLRILTVLETDRALQSHLSSNVLSPAQEETLKQWLATYQLQPRLSDLCRRALRRELYKCHHNIIYTTQQLQQVPTALKNIILLRDLWALPQYKDRLSRYRDWFPLQR